MKNRDILKTLFTVPAIAGLIYVAGCEDDEPDVVEPTNGTMDGADIEPSGAGLETEPPAEPAGGQFGQTGQTGQELSDNVREQIEQPLSNLEDTLDSAAETTTAEGGSAISRAQEAVDGLRNAVDEGSMAEVSRYVTQLQSMKAQLPANVQQMIDQIAAAVPGVSSIPGTGDSPTTRPGGSPPAGNN